MRTTLNDQLSKAIKEKEKDDVINHPIQVRKLAQEYFKKYNTNTTPEMKVNGQTITFINGKDSSIDSIILKVNGQIFSGSDMNNKLNEIDLVGEKFLKNRQKIEKSKEIKSKANNLARIAKIDLTRKALAAPATMNNEGQGIIMNLLRLLGRTLSKSVQNR